MRTGSLKFQSLMPIALSIATIGLIVSGSSNLHGREADLSNLILKHSKDGTITATVKRLPAEPSAAGEIEFETVTISPEPSGPADTEIQTVETVPEPPAAVNTETQTTKEPIKKPPVLEDVETQTFRRAITSPETAEPINGFDLEAVEVYFSSQVGDSDKNYVVANPEPGQNVYAHFVWRCYGSGNTGAFRMEFKINDTLLAGGDDNADGGYEYVTWLNSPWTAEAGSQTLKGLLDVNSSIAESDETNNNAEQTYNIGGATFDLAAVEVYFSSQAEDTGKNYVVANPEAGQEVYPHFKWQCLGSGTTPTFLLEIKLNETVLGSGDFTADGGTSHTTWATSPWTAVAGSQTLKGLLDVNSTVDETDETNNNAEQVYNIAGMDLAAIEVYFSSQVGDNNKSYLVANPEVGQNVYPHFKWQCSGSGTTATFRLEIKLNETVLGSGDFTADGGTSYTTWATSPWSAVTGSHTLKGLLDVNSAVTESDETNNNADKAYTIGDTELDLEVLEVYFSSQAPDSDKEYVVTSPVVGQNVYPHFKWRCTGSGVTGTFRREIKVDDTILGYVEGTATAGNSYVTYSGTAWSAEAGDHYLKGLLDVNSQVSESDETNNNIEQLYSITGTTLDLAAVEVYFSSEVGDTDKSDLAANPEVGQQVYPHFQWQCIGSGTTASFRLEIKINDTILAYGNLTADGGYTYTTWTTGPWGAVAGSQTLKGLLDVNGTVAESDETNNSAEELFNIYSEPDISVSPTELSISEEEPSTSSQTYRSKPSIQTELPDTKALHVKGEVIIKIRDNVRINGIQREGTGAFGVASLNALTDRFGVYSVSRVFRNNISPLLKNVFLVKFSEGNKIEDVLRAYMSDPNIEYVEPNYIVVVNDTPYDPEIANQWYLAKVQAYDAWDVGVGNSNTIIGIIDTGVDWDHPDLADNIWANSDEIADNGIDDDGNGYVDDVRGWDFVESFSSPGTYPGEDGATTDNDPMDFNGHGTHCSGIASAVTDNSTGVAGLARGCAIMPLRAGGTHADGSGLIYMSYAASAIEYAVSNGARVVSMSFGTSGETIKNAVITAYNNNVVVLHAAGNDNEDSYGSADNIVESISVAATDQSDLKASFSNYGSWIDVSAPGVSMLNTYFNDTYDYLSGTSMATPLVAGLAGLILAQNPSLTSAEVTDIIKTSADDIDAGNPSYTGMLGSGRINAYAALLMTGQQNSFVISNAGGDTLRVSVISSDKEWLTFSPAVPPIKELTAGQSSAIQCVVDWSQVSQPSEQATVTISSDDADEPSLTVTITAYPLVGPEVTSIIPSSGANNGTVAITNLAGTNFESAATAKLSKGGSVIAATDLTVASSTQITCTFDLTEAAEGKWDVVVANPNGKSSGGSGSDLFTVFRSEDVTPDSIVLVSPAVGSMQPSCTPLFYWQDINFPTPTDTVAYAIWISEDSLFSDTVPETTLANQYKPASEMAENTTYFWKVNAWDQEELFNIISDVSSFSISEELVPPVTPDTVNLITPTLGSSETILEPLFYWEPIPYPEPSDTVQYDLWIGQDTSFTAVEPYPLSENSCLSPVSLADNDLYYWKVKAYDLNSLLNIDSPVYHFYTNLALDPPLDFGLLRPLDQSIFKSTIIDSTLIFSWQGTSDPDYADTVVYNFALATDSLFPEESVILEWSSPSDTSLTVNPAALMETGTTYYWRVAAIDTDSLQTWASQTDSHAWKFTIGAPTSVEQNGNTIIPDKFVLSQNYPNPFNPETNIQFALPEDCIVTLRIYNISGQVIRTLRDERIPAGYHQVRWDGKDNNGREVGSGIYFYQIQAGEFRQTKRMVLIK